MKNFTLKVIVLTFFITLSSYLSKAQTGYNYSQFDLGLGGTFNSVQADVQTKKSSNSLFVSLNYNQTPFINYIFEVQAGNLKGGNELKDSTGREFSNNYVAYTFRAQVQAGEIIDYSQSQFANAIKNLYLSAGLGYIVNSVTANRYSYLIPGYYTPGENSSNEVFIPLRVGYEFKLFNEFGDPSVKFDIAYQANFIMGDELDGFNIGKHNDAFSQVVVGVKFAFGPQTSYRKQIHY